MCMKLPPLQCEFILATLNRNLQHNFNVFLSNHSEKNPSYYYCSITIAFTSSLMGEVHVVRLSPCYENFSFNEEVFAQWRQKGFFLHSNELLTRGKRCEIGNDRLYRSNRFPTERSRLLPLIPKRLLKSKLLDGSSP